MIITDFIVCDDIRSELGSKFSLMGIYANDIKFSKVPDEAWPIAFRLSCFIRLVNSLKPKKYKFEIKVMFDGNELVQAEGEAPLSGDVTIVNLPVVFPLVNIPSTGDMSIEFKLRSGKKLIVEQKKVMKISNLQE